MSDNDFEVFIGMCCGFGLLHGYMSTCVYTQGTQKITGKAVSLSHGCKGLNLGGYAWQQVPLCSKLSYVPSPLIRPLLSCSHCSFQIFNSLKRTSKVHIV